MKRSSSSAFSPNKVARATGIEQEDQTLRKVEFKPFSALEPTVSFNGSPASRNVVNGVSPTRLVIGSRRNNSQTSFASSGLVEADLTVQKIINDPIHTAIKLDRLCCHIVDTPQFQRLRSLKQLGTCVYVFPSATHSRFEHSLGVAHLSQRVCEALMQHQPELHISKEDILSVKVAGLCHDLGHGPFSHVFDGVFIKAMFPDGLKNKDGSTWRHEDGSVQMFRYILEDNNINLRDFGLSNEDQTFIEEIIQGTKEHERRGRGAEKFFLYDIVNNTRSGLDVDKLDYFQRDMRYANVTLAANFERFLDLGRVVRAVSIPNVQGNYFEKTGDGGWVARPETSNVGHAEGNNGTAAATVGVSSQETARDEGEDAPMFGEKYQLMVCYPQKLVYEALDVFSIRFRMHKQVYTHKAVKQVEFMITDALIAADPYIRISGTVTEDNPSGKYRMSECIFDMQAMSNLNDHVIDMIKYDDNPGLQTAKDILKRIERRQLYTCLGKSPFTREDVKKGLVKNERQIKEEIRAISQQLANDPNLTGIRYAESPTIEDGNGKVDEGAHVLYNDTTGFSQDSFYSIGQQAGHSQLSTFAGYTALAEEDIIVEKMHIHYGLKDKNPVSRMRFFPKSATTDVIGEEVKDKVYLTSMPIKFEDMAVRVFCRHADKEATARKSFQLWCKEKLCSTPFQLQGADADAEDDDAFVLSQSSQ